MQADIGIALGAGTDIAIESSDVIIVGERLSAMADAFRIGAGAYRRTKQNIAIAFNGIGVPLATTGLVHPIWAMAAMAAMAASVTLVLANSFGLRLFTAGSWRRFADPARLREEHTRHDAAGRPVRRRRPKPRVPSEAPAQPDRPARLVVALTGVHCGSCLAHATAAVAGLDGVVAARPLPQLGDLEISYRPDRAAPSVIEARLRQQGFGVAEPENPQ
jgi:cation transport ATPase